MRRKLFIVCFIAILALSVCHATDVKAALKDHDWDYGKKIIKTDSGFQYFAHPSKNGKEAWVYGVSGKFGAKNVTLSIPKTIDGRKVTRIGEAQKTGDYPLNIAMMPVEYWNSNTGYHTNRIKKVVLPDTVEVIEPCTFSGLNIETIKIPSKVTQINAYTFFECGQLKKVILPDKLKKVDPLAFNRCPKLKTLKLSPKNKAFKIKSNRFLMTKKGNELVFAAAGGGKTLKIPNGVKTIKKNACNNVTASVVHIPASVQKLEQRAFTSQINDVTVDAKNKVFQKDGQCIYRKKDKSLAVGIVDADLNLHISDTVEKLTSEYSLIHYNEDEDPLENIVFPPNLKSVKGTGLHIVSDTLNVYFTGVTPPEVTKPKKSKQSVFPFPMHNVYVPKDSVKAYKAWYNKYGTKDDVRWHAYEGQYSGYLREEESDCF